MAERYTTLGAHFTVKTESTYGTGDGSASSEFPLLIGEDNFAEARDVTARPVAASRGPAKLVVRRNRSEGSLGLELDYNIMSRWLKACLGAVESDAIASPISLYDNFYYQTDELPSLELTIHRGNVTWVYGGCVVESWTLTYDGQQEDLKLTVQLAGLAPTYATFSSSPSFPGQAAVKAPHATTMTFHGTAMLGKIRRFSITGNNALDTGRWVGGQTNRAKPLRRGTPTVTGEIECEWDDEVYLEGSPDSGYLYDWTQGTTGSLQFIYNNGSADSSERQFSIYCPAIVIDGEPIAVQDQGVISCTVRFQTVAATVSADTLATIATGSANAAYTKQLCCMTLSNAEDGSSQ